MSFYLGPLNIDRMCARTCNPGLTSQSGNWYECSADRMPKTPAVSPLLRTCFTSSVATVKSIIKETVAKFHDFLVILSLQYDMRLIG